MSIRLKVILPYLLLTVVVAVIGVYVVTRLVSNTIQERLTNQLLEAGRVVSDNFVRQEVRHVETARIVAFTAGVADALAGEDRDTVFALVEPLFAGLGVENLILISPQGKEVAHLIVDETGQLERVEQGTGVANSVLVAPFLTNKSSDAPPRRALGVNYVNDEVYYYTSIPVALDSGEFAGVVVIGTSIRSILPFLKSTALADIIIYSSSGQAIGTTLSAADQSALQIVSITEEEYRTIIVSENIVTGNNIKIDGRSFSVARGPLQVGSDRIGVFAVALPLDFVIQSGANSRTTYVVLFTIVFFIVVVIGYVVSRLIINPIYSLVNTSQAIAGGNLEQRTGIHTRDEIGTLASTFDEMTIRLQERTHELERTNEILRNIDKTKTNFIQISAHELRTPLTLIMGYSQMLEQDTKNNPELLSLAQGILDGSERMTDIVDSMLDVSRIDSNTLFLRKTGLRLDLLIKKVNKGFEKAFEERNIEIHTHELRDLPLIPADPDLLVKVFYHLIMNAIKFTPDGGSITISGKYLNGSEPPCVEVAIQDTGIGIDPALHKLIFEKFNQTGDVLLHSSGKTKFKGGGPGLGLAIARGIVEAHGGRIWVESHGYNEQTPPGSTFFVSLPVEKQTETSL
ncbi:MAG: HAMP domain-containing protein [Anaerolineales bacterium]|nr:HAMP domain-containing protein [Anaerolineales bacterium]MBK8824406.1 HAMP domain-containing protein [Anaerolineales bacterium]